MASLPWVTSIVSLNTLGSASTAFMRTSVPMSKFSSPRGSASSAVSAAERTAAKLSQPQ